MARAADSALDLAGEAGRENATLSAEMEESAFTSLYERTSKPLWAYLHRLSGDAALADDMLQEAYCRVLRANAPRDSDALRAYLFRVATNLVLDEWRRRTRRRTDVVAVPEQATPARSPALRVDVHRALGRLKPQERALLWLAYVEGSAHREIAATLGCKEGSVKVLLHRSRAKLARVLKQLGYERA